MPPDKGQDQPPGPLGPEELLLNLVQNKDQYYLLVLKLAGLISSSVSLGIGFESATNVSFGINLIAIQFGFLSLLIPFWVYAGFRLPLMVVFESFEETTPGQKDELMTKSATYYLTLFFHTSLLAATCESVSTIIQAAESEINVVDLIFSISAVLLFIWTSFKEIGHADKMIRPSNYRLVGMFIVTCLQITFFLLFFAAAAKLMFTFATTGLVLLFVTFIMGIFVAISAYVAHPNITVIMFLFYMLWTYISAGLFIFKLEGDFDELGEDGKEAFLTTQKVGFWLLTASFSMMFLLMICYCCAACAGGLDN